MASSSRDRVARHRQSRKDSRVYVRDARWDRQSQQWLGGLVVQPWPHVGSAQSYNAGRCQCGGCLDAHRAQVQRSRVMRRVGQLTTDTLSLRALSAMALRRPVTVPPPHPFDPGPRT